MLVCLFEDEPVRHLFPLTRTRAVYALRVGHRSLGESVLQSLGAPRAVLHCRQSLADVVREGSDLPVNRIAEGVDVLFVNGRLFFEAADALSPVLEATRSAEPVVFFSGEDVAAAWVPASHGPAGFIKDDFVDPAAFGGMSAADLPGVILISRIWDMLGHIGAAIDQDFRVLSHGINIFERPDTQISERAELVNGERIYVAPRAEVRAGAVLDARGGPIIVGRGAQIMENAVIHGPAAVGDRTIVKVGAHLKSCTIGPRCKVAGEVHDSVMHSYSNKSHAGFMGNSYLGSWVNLGAHTNTSNLKNDYGEVSAFNEVLGRMEKTGGIFAGLVMADHSKCGIDSMFNTGTVVGVSCNLFGSGYFPRYIPSFMWGGPHSGFVTYLLDKALTVAEVVMRRREQSFTPAMRTLLGELHDETEADRARGPVR